MHTKKKLKKRKYGIFFSWGYIWFLKNFPAESLYIVHKKNNNLGFFGDLSSVGDTMKKKWFYDKHSLVEIFFILFIPS